MAPTMYMIRVQLRIMNGAGDSVRGDIKKGIPEGLEKQAGAGGYLGLFDFSERDWTNGAFDYTGFNWEATFKVKLDPKVIVNNQAGALGAWLIKKSGINIDIDDDLNKGIADGIKKGIADGQSGFFSVLYLFGGAASLEKCEVWKC